MQKKIIEIVIFASLHIRNYFSQMLYMWGKNTSPSNIEIKPSAMFPSQYLIFKLKVISVNSVVLLE